MHVARAVTLVLAVSSWASAQTGPAAPSLDFEFFKTRVQPIFLAERPGHARCIACHGSGTPLRLQPVAAGQMHWTDEDSRKNFDIVRRVVMPGNVKSRLLMHPLAEQAGGDFYHSGGKHWASQADPEWQTVKAWVMGETLPAQRQVRIIQTNSAGDNVHIIDPATNTIVGVIGGIEAGHGAGASPDGRRIYVSDEAESTLDIVDAKTLMVTKKIPLSGHPNNMAVGKDGRRVYVGIIQAPGGVDVIDTVSMQRVKTIPTARYDSQRVRHTGWTVRCRRIDCRCDHQRDRRQHRGAGVDAEDGPRRSADGVLGESRWIDEMDLHAAHRAQRVCGHRFRDPQGDQTDLES